MKICIDLGATNIKGALIDDGVLLQTAKFPTDHSDGVRGIENALLRTVAALQPERADGISFSSAGDIDSERAVCVYATGNLEGFTGFDFAEFSRKNFHLPAFALNDGHAALLGEMKFGAGKEFVRDNVIMLTLGSGVGGAYWKDGALCANASNDYARFGHVLLKEGGIPCNCGRTGCIEQYLSGRAINRRASAAGIEEDIFKAYAHGDEKAAAVLDEIADDFTLSLEKIEKINAFEVCILGGGVAEAMQTCLDLFSKKTPKRLVLAELGNRAGMLGAYAFARIKQGGNI